MKKHLQDLQNFKADIDKVLKEQEANK
jgi:hypothetical protein